MMHDITIAPDPALDAWNDYADKRQLAEATMSNPLASQAERMSAHQSSIRAYERFHAVFVAPTPADLAEESARLAVEGLLFITLLAAFIGLFLPDLEASFWPLAITFLVVAALGGWAVHLLGRVGRHLGRRL